MSTKYRQPHLRTQSEVLGHLIRNQHAAGNITPFHLMDALFSIYSNTVNANSAGLTADVATEASANAARLNALILDLSSNGGGTLLLSEGVYYVDGPVNLANNVRLAGAGRDVTFIELTDQGGTTSTDAVRIANTNNAVLQNLTVEVGPQSGTGTVRPVFATANTLLRLDSVRVSGGHNGSVAGSGSGLTMSNHLEAVYVTDVIASENDGDGFNVSQSVDPSFERCTAIDNGRHGWSVNGGASLRIQLSNGIDNGQFGTGNNFFVTGTAGVLLDEVYAFGAAESNIRFDQADHCHLSASNVRQAGTHGVYITGADYTLISNNIFEENSKAATATYDDVHIAAAGATPSLKTVVTDNFGRSATTAPVTRAFAVEVSGEASESYVTDNSFEGGYSYSPPVELATGTDSYARNFFDGEWYEEWTGATPLITNISPGGRNFNPYMTVAPATGLTTLDNSAHEAASDPHTQYVLRTDPVYLSPFNLFNDGGRFADVPEARGLTAGTFTAPYYWNAFNGATFEAGPKWYHNNLTFGGSASGTTLDPIMEALTSKVRDTTVGGGVFGRFGPEFYSLKVTAGAGTALPAVVDAITHYLIFNTELYPVARLHSLGCYFYVESGSVAINVLSSAEGFYVEGELLAARPRYTNADGWKHFVRLHDRSVETFSGYDNNTWRFCASPGSVIHFAIPYMFPGAVNPDLYHWAIPSLDVWSA